MFDELAQRGLDYFAIRKHAIPNTNWLRGGRLFVIL